MVAIHFFFLLTCMWRTLGALDSSLKCMISLFHSHQVISGRNLLGAIPIYWLGVLKLGSHEPQKKLVPHLPFYVTLIFLQYLKEGKCQLAKKIKRVRCYLAYLSYIALHKVTSLFLHELALYFLKRVQNHGVRPGFHSDKILR